MCHCQHVLRALCRRAMPLAPTPRQPAHSCAPSSDVTPIALALQLWIILGISLLAVLSKLTGAI